MRPRYRRGRPPIPHFNVALSRPHGLAQSGFFFAGRCSLASSGDNIEIGGRRGVRNIALQQKLLLFRRHRYQEKAFCMPRGGCPCSRRLVASYFVWSGFASCHLIAPGAPTKQSARSRKERKASTNIRTPMSHSPRPAYGTERFNKIKKWVGNSSPRTCQVTFALV